MTPTPDHSRLIVAAAKSTLEPLGLQRKGRSRTWVDDRAWWLGIVEFQPSSWSKGSYVNVGVMWLWAELQYLVYDVGGRVDGFGHGFESYSSEEQFRDVAERLAQSAASEVLRFRHMFSDPIACADYYDQLDAPAPADYLDAGIASGLSGRASAAHAWLRRVLAIDDDRPFVVAEKSRARELATIVDDPAAFKPAVRSYIERSRELLGLPLLSDWPW